jgi:hypothetical protein
VIVRETDDCHAKKRSPSRSKGPSQKKGQKNVTVFSSDLRSPPKIAGVSEYICDCAVSTSELTKNDFLGKKKRQKISRVHAYLASVIRRVCLETKYF